MLDTNANLAVTVLVIADLVDIVAAAIITKIIVCISDECCDVRDLDSITVQGIEWLFTVCCAGALMILAHSFVQFV